MNNLKIVLLNILIFFLFIITGCQTTSDTGENADLSKEDKTSIYDSCFEVVVKKSEKDSLVYEKELPWELLPFNIRNDEYHSIGTAFAISENELLTAFHVLDLTSNSLIYTDYFIRDKNGDVFEIDQVTKFSKARDFVKFTVKNKTFDSYLNLNRNYSINEAVYSAGNAYGEGIIIRKGNLIGTIPEDENGEWEKLRSSSDVNSGNSGGPLLNQNGDVIGVIIEKRDNIAYSLPISEVLDTPDNKGFYHYRLRFSFDLFPEKSDLVNYDLDVDLPMGYKEVRKFYASSYTDYYISQMDEFFKTYEDETFPNGESSLEALENDATIYMPQVIFKDESDLTWNISSLDTKDSNLKDNGLLTYASIINNSVMFYLEKPDTISLKELNSNPKIIMDLILEGINIPRTISGQDTRIISFGEPYSIEPIIDDYNREWTKSTWILEFSDEYIITYTMPTPEGSIILFQSGNTGNMPLMTYNYKKFLNFIEVCFYGKYKEWQEFLEMPSMIPSTFSNVKIEKIDGNISVKSKDFELITNNELTPTDDDTIIILDYDIYALNNTPIWDIRRIVVSEYQKDNYLVLYRQIKPDERLRDTYHDDWKNTINFSHPFNNTPYQEDGETNIGTILGYKLGDEEPNMVYSLFIGREGSVNNEIMTDDLEKISFKIK